MFGNSGGRIRTVAVILAVLTTEICLILAFALGKDYRGDFRPAIFWPLLIGGPTVALVSSIILYGFGDLIESNSRCEALLDDILKELKKDKANPATNNETARRPVRQQTFQSSNAKTVVCPKCGMRIDNTRRDCPNCGTSIHESTDDSSK